MRRRTRFGTGLAAIALLAGCQQVSSAIAPTSAARATLEVNLRFARRVQSVMPYSQADVKHLQIEVFAVSGSTETPVGETVDLLPAAFSDPVTLSGLRSNTLYRLRAYAYASSDTSRLISNTVDGSSVDVAVTDDDAPTITNLPVRLVGTAKPTVSTFPADFGGPVGLAFDASGNLFVASALDDTIRKITPAGAVSTFAGTGISGADAGIGITASFNTPTELAFDASGNLYVADYLNDEIRAISPAGVVTTFAGSTTSGSADGTGAAAGFSHPAGLAFDANGNLFVADQANNEIRKITPAGAVTTFAGSSTAGSADGAGSEASFDLPSGLAFDASGNLYVADQGNNEIRMITPDGVVSTFAGSTVAGAKDGVGAAASFRKPTGVACGKNGDLYVADSGNDTIRQISSTRDVTTLAGNGTPGEIDGPALSASFDSPRKLAFDASGHLYVSDYSNDEVRELQ